MSSDSTRKPLARKAAIAKPPKPYATFPLTPHNSGKWMKKIRGKIHYFGQWARREEGHLVRVEGDGWKEALEVYKNRADDLHAGRTPRVKTGELTITDLCNAFLTAKLRKLEAGEIGPRMFAEYKSTTDRIVARFGKTRLVDDLAADDFEALRDAMAKQWGPVRLGNEIQKVRTLFKYGIDDGLIERPVRFGSQFKKPAKSVLRKHRAAGGKRLFTATEIHKLLDKGSLQLKAMILLGINAGFGNGDVASLPQTALDLDGGWISFPRPKTGLERRCWLWPETVEALRTAIDARPDPKGQADAGCVFITMHGNRWVRTSGPNNAPVNSIGLEFGKLLLALGINGRRGLGFYSLRHTFRTIADATKDFPAVRLIMGHADDSIDEVYREGIEDKRLEAVAEHVRQWLFGEAPADSRSGIDSDPVAEPVSRFQKNAGNDRPTLKLFAG